MRNGCDATLLIEELPCIGPVEATDTHGGDELGIEVAEVHALLGARLRLQRLPMSGTPTNLAANVAKRPITPDVL